MQNYDIYAIGNALVDFDFEVSDETLHRLNIEKGTMTLINSHDEQRLLEELDGVKHVKASGGSAANTIITAQQLGINTFYSCKVADDYIGDFFVQDMQRQGVDTNLNLQLREKGHTGKCVAMITPDAERTMHTYLGISEELSTNEVVPSVLVQSNYLYIEGYLVTSPTAFQAALTCQKIARDNGVKIALGLADINMIRFFNANLQALLSDKIEVLFANEVEALAFTDTDEVEVAIQKMGEFAKMVIVTCGERGVYILEGEHLYFIETFQEQAIDTIGAGDVFAGAMLYGLAKGYSTKQCATLACRAASIVVTKFGPRLTDTGINRVKTLEAEMQLEN